MPNRWFLIAGILLAAMHCAGCSSKDKPKPVAMYCAAGLRDPVTELISAFEKDRPGSAVSVDYGGSGELLGRIRAASAPQYRPDIFIAAEESYAEQARQLGLVDRCQTLAYFVPVIAVAKGNPKGIHSLADLDRPDVNVALGEPRGPAIGLVTDQILAKAGLMSIRRRAGGTFATVQTVAAQVSLHNADAAIIWDTVARQGDFKHLLDVVYMPDAPLVRIVICRASQCPHPELADDFIGLATQSDVARSAFRRFGFNVQTETSPASSATGAP